MARALRDLKQLEALKFEFGPQAAAGKIRCLEALKTAQFASAGQITRLHEILCFLAAWPDDATVLSLAESLLGRFAGRRDLGRHREELADSGIAGTAIHYRFYAATALWLADRWPDRLEIDWPEFENAAMLERYLAVMASYSETPGTDRIAMEVPAWIDRLKGPEETDAAFVIRRLAALITDGFLFEQFYESLDVPLILAPGPDGPSRTRAKYDQSPIEYQPTPLDRSRPDAAGELRRPLAPARLASPAEGVRLVDLAHAAMVTRQRDLDAFAYADPNDVSLLDDGGGLEFVLYGVLPERRFLLECLYGFVILKNGVPVSYGSITSLFNSAELSYSIFDTFRGGESARLYVRTLAMACQMFGCDTFSIDSYQLGEENEDALESGAWWFYQKLGFRPRDKTLRRLMDRELSTMKRRPRHRSTRAVLQRLATDGMYLTLNHPRDDVLGVLELANVGLKISDLFARRFGSDREQGATTLAAEAAGRLGASSFDGWSAGEQLAWRRWSPLVALLDDLDGWPAAEREALVALVRAKGGRQELDYLHRFNALARLRNALVTLAAD